ncbi:MAG: hypothetical protein GX366_01850 [Epulopiscium sp.]|nr:hypothetical protein [Candidatus Epulonipiscium sp.]
MKDNIYTIPLIDAFHSNHECPFCFIYNNMENEALEFMLGSAYMADNIREKTNKLGFCSNHYKLLYEHGNRLGLALMMHTHLLELKKTLDPLLEANSPRESVSKLSIFKKKETENNISKFISENKSNCYICDKIDRDMNRYLDTLFLVWKKDPKFIELVKSCNGFCLSHFAALLDMAPRKLSGNTLDEFYNIIIPLTKENIDRIEEELSWFIDKYDYRNKDAPWKNSKDALPRSIQKIASMDVTNYNDSNN